MVSEISQPSKVSDCEVAEIMLLSIITCPYCGYAATEQMPPNACQFFYDCKNAALALNQSRAIVACSVLTVRFRVRRYNALDKRSGYRGNRLAPCPPAASRRLGFSVGRLLFLINQRVTIYLLQEASLSLIGDIVPCSR